MLLCGFELQTMFGESFRRKSAPRVMPASCTADCVFIIIAGQCVHVFKGEKCVRRNVHQVLCT